MQDLDATPNTTPTEDGLLQKLREENLDLQRQVKALQVGVGGMYTQTAQ